MKHDAKALVFGVLLLMAGPLFAQNVFLELNLNDQRVQNLTRSLRPQSDLELFRVIEQAGNDRKISGIILNVSACQLERATLWELRNTLEK
jgi:hypothetical protein